MHPENFGRELQQKLRKRLCEDVEGTVPETTGIIVAVLRFYDEQDVKRGLIEYETGYASFIVNYEAIIYRPFKNQVLDAKVTNVHEHGFSCTTGIANFSIFVSKHNMPKEYTYKAENEMWAHSEDDSSDQEISKGCVVRLRVVNVNFKSKTALSCIGTIDGDYLGVLENDDGGEGDYL